MFCQVATSQIVELRQGKGALYPKQKSTVLLKKPNSPEVKVSSIMTTIWRWLWYKVYQTSQLYFDLHVSDLMMQQLVFYVREEEQKQQDELILILVES